MTAALRESARRWRGLLVAAVACAGLCLPASAQVVELPQTFEVEAKVEVRPDMTYRAVQTVKTRIRTNAGLSAAAAIAGTYIEGFETLVVASAAIERDGTATPVDVALVKTSPPQSGPQPDQRTLSLIFPDVRVGDTLILVTERNTRQAAFNGHFTYAWTFARTDPWTKARYVVDAPVAIALQVNVSHDDGRLRHDRAEADGRVLHTFSYERGTLDAREEPGSVASIDRDPSFTLTTFADHAAFAAAHWREAAPRAVATPEITALAGEITRGASSARDKAIAVDRWVKRNVRYQAIYLGRERWVPQTAAAVLAAKSGDCKDHAVLMTALLTASGVASEHVLVNLGNSYIVPALPPGAFNHVMVHVAEAELTLDPSAPLAAPGVLSLQTYGKPALMVGPNGARVSRTPAMTADDHTTSAQTTITVAANGAIRGETVQTATGIFATSARQAVLRVQAEGARAAEQRLTALGTPGSGKIEASSPSEIREPYIVKSTFALADLADLPLAGNRRMPIGLPIHARPGQFLLGPRVGGRKLAFSCFAGTQTEEIAIAFAEGLALPRVPQPKKIANRHFSYNASATLEGRTFRVRRTFASLVTEQACAASIEAEIEEPMKEVTANLGSMLVFPGTTNTGAKKRP